MTNENSLITWITAISSIIIALAAITGLILSWNAAQQSNNIARKALELQYQPQIAISFASDRIPTCLVGTNYSQCDYFMVYKSDIYSAEGPTGKMSKIPEISWAEPVRITFYNLGNVGTRLERIRKDFSCDPAGEGDWQVDIMKNRNLLPGKNITYSNYLSFDFSKVPNKNMECSITFKFIFFNNYTIKKTYKVFYYNYNDNITLREREAYINRTGHY